MDIAWRNILSGLMKESGSQRLRVLFPAEEWIESQEFSIVHRTILGLNVLNLDDLLNSIPVATMDLRDAGNRTALWWAARRGDYPAMTSLLRYNISISQSPNVSSNALIAAMQSGNQQCVRLLLPYFQNFSYYVQNGWSALHPAAEYGMDIDILETIMSSGIAVDSRCRLLDETPLMLAAVRDHLDTCRYFLDRDADPNDVNVHGETALHYAIAYNSHKSVEILIQHTNHRLKTNAGESLLHCAAQHSDTKSLEILYSSDIRGIGAQDTIISSSPTQKPMKVVGLTALEIAETRTDVAAGWLAMFWKLHHKVECREP